MIPIFVALGVMAIFYLGLLMGAWMTETRQRPRPALMPLADSTPTALGSEESLSWR